MAPCSYLALESLYLIPVNRVLQMVCMSKLIQNNSALIQVPLWHFFYSIGIFSLNATVHKLKF